MSFQAGIGYAPEWLIWVSCVTPTPTVLERAESAIGVRHEQMQGECIHVP